MTDDDYRQMAAVVRKMRVNQRNHLERAGYPHGSSGAAYHHGVIAGLEQVLSLLCPDPWADEPDRPLAQPAIRGP